MKYRLEFSLKCFNPDKMFWLTRENGLSIVSSDGYTSAFLEVLDSDDLNRMKLYTLYLLRCSLCSVGFDEFQYRAMPKLYKKFLELFDTVEEQFSKQPLDIHISECLLGADADDGLRRDYDDGPDLEDYMTLSIDVSPLESNKVEVKAAA